MKTKSIVALLMVLLMAAMAGCSGASDPAVSEPAQTQTQTAQPGPAETTEPLPTPEANSWATENKIDDGSQTTAELYELAKAEGTVVLYSISSRCTKVAESFMAAYPGIVCEAYDISSDELMEKITREYEAGVRNADVIHCKDLIGDVYMEKVMAGIFHNYYPNDIVSSISDPEMTKYGMPLYLELNQWFYNYNLFDEAPVDSWWDLTREEWKGNLLTQDPIGNQNYIAVFTSFLQHEEEIAADYEREFGQPLTEYTCGVESAAYELIYRFLNNDIIFTSSSDEVCEAVAGVGVTEKKLGYGASSKLRKNESEGWTLAPINILPATGIPNPNNLYIVNESPHPNAAKLLVRWMLGEVDGQGEGFSPFNTLGGWSVRDNVPPPEGATPLTDLHVFPFDPMFVYDNFLDMSDFILSILG